MQCAVFPFPEFKCFYGGWGGQGLLGKKGLVNKLTDGTVKTLLTSSQDDRLSEHVWSVISCV